MPREHRRDDGMGFDAQQRGVQLRPLLREMRARARPFRDDRGEEFERIRRRAAEERPAPGGEEIGERRPAGVQSRPCTGAHAFVRRGVVGGQRPALRIAMTPIAA